MTKPDNEEQVEKINDEEDQLFGVTESRNVRPTENVGVPGFVTYGGFLDEKEKNRELAGRTKYVTFSNNFSNLATIGASVRYFLNLISKAGWSVEPADDTPASKEAAEFVENVMDNTNTPWTRIVRKAAMFKFYGFSIQEWRARLRDDGVFELADIQSRPQFTIERWKPDTDGNILGVVQRSPRSQIDKFIPIEKVIHIVDDALSDSPEGLGIFRQIADSAFRLKRYIQLEGWGFETDLKGTPVATAPLGELQRLLENKTIPDQASLERILQPVKDFVSNGIKNPNLGVLLDSAVFTNLGPDRSPSPNKKWSVDVIKGGSASHAEIANAINRLNHEIARVIGTEGILLGADGAGTQALSRNKTENFFLVVDSALTEIVQAFNRQVIDRLWEINAFDEATKPKFTHETIQFKDVEQITEALRNVAQAGAPVAMDDPVINDIRDLLGLSRVELNAILEDVMIPNLDQDSDPEDELPDDRDEIEDEQ